MWKQIMILGKVKSVDLVNPVLESLISLCAGMSYAKACIRASDLHPGIALCVCTSVETLFAGTRGAVLFFSAKFSCKDMDGFSCTSWKCACLHIFILLI